MKFKVGDKLVSKHSNGKYECFKITEILNNGYVVKFENGSKNYYTLDQLQENFEIKIISWKEKLQEYLNQNKIEDMERLFNQACKDLDSYDKGYYKAKLEILNHLKQMLENNN